MILFIKSSSGFVSLSSINLNSLTKKNKMFKTGI